MRNIDNAETKPIRKRLRLKKHDYSQNGLYFVTICTNKKNCCFGRITGRKNKSEKDKEIIDFVSDLRAPTPSAAAELAVTDIREIQGDIAYYQDALLMHMQRQLQAKREELRHYETRLRYLSPANRIREKKMLSLQMEERLQERMCQLLNKKHHRLALYIERLKGLSPLEKLNSGFSYVEDKQGHNIRSVSQVAVGETVAIRVKDGVIAADVTAVQEL